MKCIIAIVVLIITSTIVLANVEPVSDHFYYLTSEPSKDTICNGAHFYEIETPIETMTDEVALIYSYDIKESKKAESYFFRLEDKLRLDNYKRYPAVLGYTRQDSALWGEVLTRTEFDSKNPNLIPSAYEYFLNKEDDISKLKFNNELLKIKVIPQIFYEALVDIDYSDILEGHMDIIRKAGLRSIPAIVVRGEYIIYPDDFKDGREAWMIAKHLSEGGIKDEYRACQR